MAKKRVAYILSHPIQYISPLLSALAKDVDMHVYYFSDASVRGHGSIDKGFGQNVKWDIPLLDGYEYTFIKNYSKRTTLSNRFWDLVNPGIIRYLRKEKAEVVILNGWTYFSVLLTVITSVILRKQIWMRAENPLNQELKKSKKVILLKKIVLKYGLFKLIDKFLYIGSQNKEFFKFYGVPEAKLISTPYSVNNDFFEKQYNDLKEKKEEIRASLGLPANKKIILFTAKYIEQKRPLDLLKAFSLLKGPDAFLVLVGEGRLRGQMEQFIKDNDLENVLLTGFINQSDISKYYSIASVFVMCSGMGETWGLSVNEAMNFELPVIVSNTCGSSFDLVKNNVNGFTFDEGDVASLARYIDIILSDTDLQSRAGKGSKMMVRQYSIQNIVDNIDNALGK